MKKFVALDGESLGIVGEKREVKVFGVGSSREVDEEIRRDLMK